MENIIKCECETTDLGFVVKHKCIFVDTIYCDKEKRTITPEDFAYEHAEAEM